MRTFLLSVLVGACVGFGTFMGTDMGTDDWSMDQLELMAGSNLVCYILVL